MGLLASVRAPPPNSAAPEANPRQRLAEAIVELDAVLTPILRQETLSMNFLHRLSIRSKLLLLASASVAVALLPGVPGGLLQ